jgi:hypothetical protein
LTGDTALSLLPAALIWRRDNLAPHSGGWEHIGAFSDLARGEAEMRFLALSKASTHPPSGARQAEPEMS